MRLRDEAWGRGGPGRSLESLCLGSSLRRGRQPPVKRPPQGGEGPCAAAADRVAERAHPDITSRCQTRECGWRVPKPMILKRKT